MKEKTIYTSQEVKELLKESNKFYRDIVLNLKASLKAQLKMSFWSGVTAGSVFTFIGLLLAFMWVFNK